MKALQDENRTLRQDNTTLQGEVEQMNRVASYVGSRVAKVLAGARRANNYNAALVGELKRWNRKLEVCAVLLLEDCCHTDCCLVCYQRINVESLPWSWKLTLETCVELLPRVTMRPGFAVQSTGTCEGLCTKELHS